ncbi:uncharacterized protein MELLADRAFT_66407 [Melampsora larici-populina 98AG31]|uniref:Uncharacterized protein n=1 Tax=Melampsora larici-populina (strain 98AG31 / pathotype 3-4-7) TaxID=747676 RepID=F4RZ29_MELLP|nr:uncharacterized protein MELLADRAFT_66407 [Melampsora larici-populina 98AG31]EGG02395.1 hypothetical protein MELLADRAFT_66407 [Melampsora larici-populina 98AG31]
MALPPQPVKNLDQNISKPKKSSSHTKNKPVQCWGAVYGLLPCESFGYPTQWNLSRANTEMQLGMEHQGYTMDDIGEGPMDDQYLPQISGLGENHVFQRIKNACIRSEILWPYEILRALNAAVNPKTYAAAERVTSFIQKTAGLLLAERIKALHNKVVQGQNICVFIHMFCALQKLES